MNYALCGFIALGGALGAIGRYLLSTWIYNKGNFTFPWGTFLVNMLGCFIMGFIYVWATDKLALSVNTKAFLSIGLIGAFTTFSTFSVETLNLMKNGELNIALVNIVGSVVLGLVAVWLGMALAH